MRLFAFLIIFCAITPRLKLLERVATFAAPLQASCTFLFSESFRHRELAQGFVCGTPIESIEDRSIFQRTGLIHLMVVSGGHLQLLAFLLLLPAPKFVQRNRMFRTLLWLVLLAYCLFTGFQAPVVRAFVSRVIASLNYYFRWNWDLGKIHVAGGLLCLILFPEWLQSFSFFLSWLASMAFLLAPLCFAYRSRKARASFWQMLLTGGLIQAFVSIVFGTFSVLAVLMNALIAVPLAFLILLISLAPLLSSYLIPISDRIWDWLLLALEKTLPFAPAPKSGFSSQNWMLLWGFLILLQAVLHLIHQQRYRASNV